MIDGDFKDDGIGLDNRKTGPVDIDIGIGIDQKQLDDIDNMQSAPSSPGLILRGEGPQHHDSIDFFTLDSPNLEPGIKSDSNSLNTTFNSMIRRRKSQHPSDINLNITTSPDSYFSQSRRSSESKAKKKNFASRRASDVSDRSDDGSLDMGSSVYGDLTESDTDVLGTPLAKFSNKKTKSALLNEINSEYGTYNQYDDGAVYRTTSHTSDAGVQSDIADSFTGPPASRSRSSSFSTTRSKGRRRDGAEREGDGSATAQIFKNLLILEESLRQQYIQQQGMRYKYSSFLVVLVLVFIYSTYTSVVYSVSDGMSSSELTGTTTSGLVADRSVISIQEDYNAFTSSVMQDGLFCNSNLVVDDAETDGSRLNNPQFPVFSNGYKTKSQVQEEPLMQEADAALEESSVGELSSLTQLLHKITSIITFMTLVLFYMTGEYTRTISRPRKFLVTANKGIRQLNVRLVKVKARAFNRILGCLRWKQRCAHRCGVEHVKLVLNPRVFSTASREQWELYRNQFWDLESVRRGALK